MVTVDESLARFSAAFGAGNVDAIMALMTEDVVFESTAPVKG
jgi:ketosteroid isomerase-like protein